MLHSYPDPTQSDQDAFVLRLYFGADGNDFKRIIHKAYLDLSRTVHGAGTFPDARDKASHLLHQELSSLPQNSTVGTQSGFDLWHRQTCNALCTTYAECGYENFFIGQAQKWVNMALKYVFVFGEKRLSGFTPLYPLCHVPIDNILRGTEEFEGLATFKEPWSRIIKYEDYMSFQVAVRNRFPSSAPLAVEFWAWQRRGAADSLAQPDPL
jgi:hypothetical protein